MGEVSVPILSGRDTQITENDSNSLISTATVIWHPSKGSLSGKWNVRLDVCPAVRTKPVLRFDDDRSLAAASPLISSGFVARAAKRKYPLGLSRIGRRGGKTPSEKCGLDLVRGLSDNGRRGHAVIVWGHRQPIYRHETE